MTIRISIEKLKEVLKFGLIFLASMNFSAKFFYFVFISLIVTLLTQRRFKIDLMSLCYLLLGSVMALYNAKEGILSMLRCLAPFCFYLVGLNLVPVFTDTDVNTQKQNDVQRLGYLLLVVVALGSFSHYLCNYLHNMGSSFGRNTNDIWTGQPMAATGQNALTCIMLGLSCSLLFAPPKKWHRIVAIAIIALILLYNLVLACRTPIIMLCILIAVGILYPQQDVKYSARLMKYLTYFCLMAALAVVVYAMNIGGVRDYLKDSILFSRLTRADLGLLKNSFRNNAKLIFISKMPEYPFGGIHLRPVYGYAHDLLLDAYDEYGIIVFILLIVILAVSLVQLFKLLRRTNYTESFKLSLLMIYCAIFMEFTVEPILMGMQWLFSCYCLLNGAMIGMNRAYHRYAHEELMDG